MDSRFLTIRILNYIVYALLWLLATTVISFTIGGIVVALIPEHGDPNIIIDFWIPSICAAAALISWVIVLFNRPPIHIPIYILVAVILMPLLLFIITVIGVGKLIIELVNRLNILGASKIRDKKPIAPPRGMVAYRGDYNGD